MRGGGFNFPYKFLRIFRSAPRGLSNLRAMIPAVRRRALTSITSTALQWHFNNNRCHWCSFRSSGAVRMPTVRISVAPSFRSERSVRVRIVRIICTRASLPSLKNRRSARSSSSIGRNHSQHVSGTVVHAYGVSFGGYVLKAHTSAALHFVVRHALTQAIKIPWSL